MSTDRVDGTEGKWELVKRTGGGLFGANLFDQKKLVIKPVTQFGKDGLVYVYVYGEGYKAAKRFVDKDSLEFFLFLILLNKAVTEYLLL